MVVEPVPAGVLLVLVMVEMAVTWSEKQDKFAPIFQRVLVEHKVLVVVVVEPLV